MIALPKRRTGSPLGHSAEISLLLHVGDQTIPLRQTTTTAIKLGVDLDIPFGLAQLEIITDGISRLSEITITGRQRDSLWLDIAFPSA